LSSRVRMLNITRPEPAVMKLGMVKRMGVIY
jgi:hypothetical protein